MNEPQASVAFNKIVSRKQLVRCNVLHDEGYGSQANRIWTWIRTSNDRVMMEIIRGYSHGSRPQMATGSTEVAAPIGKDAAIATVVKHG
jgi:hypothetical protein